MPETAKTSKTALALQGAVLLMLASQVHFSLFENGFVFSAAVMLLPFLAYLHPGYPLALTSVFGTVGIFVLRVLLQGLLTGEFTGAAASYAPEMVFVLLYGLLFSLYASHVHLRPFRWVAMLALIPIDFLSNFCELLIRLGAQAVGLIPTIIGAAVVRTLLVSLLLWALDYYGVALVRQENNERYRRLVLTTSALREELVWLRKNAELIEKTMGAAYRLHTTLSEDDADGEPAQMALEVAKDIHDVKKEYLLIIRGIDEALDGQSEIDGMYLSEVFDIMATAARRLAGEAGRALDLLFSLQEDFHTSHHYKLMAVLQNLLSNAIEAGDAPSLCMKVDEREEDNSIVFRVTDNAGGIKEGNLDKIFRPGFSTKINVETGEISRGLGLAMVMDIVREDLGGEISVESRDGGTAFTLCIPKERLVNG